MRPVLAERTIEEQHQRHPATIVEYVLRIDCPVYYSVYCPVIYRQAAGSSPDISRIALATRALQMDRPFIVARSMARSVLPHTHSFERLTLATLRQPRRFEREREILSRSSQKAAVTATTVLDRGEQLTIWQDIVRIDSFA